MQILFLLGWCCRIQKYVVGGFFSLLKFVAVHSPKRYFLSILSPVISKNNLESSFVTMRDGLCGCHLIRFEFRMKQSVKLVHRMDSNFSIFLLRVFITPPTSKIFCLSCFFLLLVCLLYNWMGGLVSLLLLPPLSILSRLPFILTRSLHLLSFSSTSLRNCSWFLISFFPPSLTFILFYLDFCNKPVRISSLNRLLWIIIM